MNTQTLAFVLSILAFNLLPKFVVSSDNSIQVNLIKCLKNHSHVSNPISPSIYTPQNTSFSNILQSNIRILRFNTSTTRKPLLIVTPTHVSHIEASILCTKHLGVEMKVRSGGHDYEGLSYVSIFPFNVVDIFNLRSIGVNIKEETAWVAVGATLDEVYYAIANKSGLHSYPAGVCPTVGAGGHISGEGYGNLIRKYGLTSDNVVDIKVMNC